MLANLKDIEQNKLPKLLSGPDESWKTLDVIYHPPHVERLWMAVGDYRLFLHRIWPCDPYDALWHPHDWPSAVKIVSGAYEHSVMGSQSPTVACISELAQGSYYEMTEPRAWHCVRPLDGPVYSIMLTGKPYPKAERVKFPKPQVSQPELAPKVKREILEFFRSACI